MNATRVILYFVGVALVVAALWMFFFQAGLNRWIPVGIAVAAMLLIIGVAVMGAAEKRGGGLGGEDININKRVEERHVDVDAGSRRQTH